MAITTGAADAGVLNLDMGNRARARNPGSGDSFASALDTHMQKPRSEQPGRVTRPKHGTSAQQPAPQEKNGEEPAPRAGRVAAEKPADPGVDEAPEGVKKEVAGPDQGLVALLLQSRLNEGDEKAGESPPLAHENAAESGKNLPQPGNEGAAVALLGATTPATTEVSEDGAGVALPTATSGARAIDPRIAAQNPTAATSELTMEATEPEAEPEAERSVLVLNRAGDAVREPVSDLPVQAARSDLPTTATSAGEKADSFAATLAALRDVAPRSGGGDAVSSVSPGPAAMVNVPQAATNAGSAAPTLPTVSVPVGQQGWDQVVGERVLWMTRHGLQEAKIELNPRDLGPIEVKVSVQQDQASVAFTAHSPAARDALEAAMPRLREMLADSGLNLAQSDVFHRSPQQQAEGGWGNGGQHSSGNLLGGDVEEPPATTVETPLPSDRAVDYYA